MPQLLFSKCPIVFLLFLVHSANGHGEITVCTYNLWNVMFSWEIRMRHIANIVRHAECDVLLLQEVRLHADRSRSQADFLQHLLPQFRWVNTRLADSVTKPAHSYWTGWEMEGLAVLSKVPTGQARVEKLSKVHGPDTNQRIALHVPVFLDRETTVHVLAVHLSYHRQQQCQNAGEILQYIDKNKLTNVVVAGDFNVYPDFPDPVLLFRSAGQRVGEDGNRCEVSLMSSLSSPTLTFQDAWEVTHGHSPGLTFSNMPEPGLTSRPDRVLTSSTVRAAQVSLHGQGAEYKAKHSTDIFIRRLHRVMEAAHEAFNQRAGYPCLQDCGPHGRCRCGVCVKSEGEREACHLPDCEECSPAVFVRLCFLFSAAAFFFVLAGTACVKILVVASHIDQSGPGPSLWPGGFASCCLCNPLILRQPTVTARHRVGRVLRCVGVGRLPPVYLLLLSLTLMVVLVGVARVMFGPMLDTTRDVMAEEYFPSDHLMVAAKLEVQ
ncbi:uncharacterized protein LOC143284717 [Babylonia areolata]|uniref:uncharacterized protein LOC143284717 n=1 Tax=Babylonia areolata TaxID=304850 RepID=UPI003FCF73EB